MKREMIAKRASEIALGFDGTLATAGGFIAGLSVGARLALESPDIAVEYLAAWQSMEHTQREADDFDNVVASLKAAAR